MGYTSGNRITKSLDMHIFKFTGWYQIFSVWLYLRYHLHMLINMRTFSNSESESTGKTAKIALENAVTVTMNQLDEHGSN